MYGGRNKLISDNSHKLENSLTHLPNKHHKPWKEETRSIYVEEDILEDQNTWLTLV